MPREHFKKMARKSAEVRRHKQRFPEHYPYPQKGNLTEDED